MTKNNLINLIKECIQEVLNENNQPTTSYDADSLIIKELQEATKCNCGSGLDSDWKLDARGIPLAKVCPKCENDKLKGFRHDVLTNPNYKADEPIEPDDMEEAKCKCESQCSCHKNEGKDDYECDCDHPKCKICNPSDKMMKPRKNSGILPRLGKKFKPATDPKQLSRMKKRAFLRRLKIKKKNQ